MGDEFKEKVAGYMRKAKPLFEDLKVMKKAGIDAQIISRFHTMTLAYYADARHFYEEGEYFNALAALEYAEGWLDAGKTLGIFETSKKE